MNSEVCVEDIDRLIAEHGRGDEAIIPILHAVQDRYHYLPPEALERICATTTITPASIETIATFFPRFRRKPAGKHTISVCDGTACHLKGAPEVYEALREHLGVPAGDDTDATGEFTVETVRCLGCCTLAPVVQVDAVTYGHVTPDSVPGIIEGFRAEQAHRQAAARAMERESVAPAGEIRVGSGSCCVAGGSDAIRQELLSLIAAFHLDIHVKRVSCVGMCHQTPLLEVVLPEEGVARTAGPRARTLLYARVRPEDVRDILVRHFPPRNPASKARVQISKLLARWYTGEADDTDTQRFIDTGHQPVAAFLSGQRRLVTECCGELTPNDFDEYGDKGGCVALKKCLGLQGKDAALSAEAIIDEIGKGGLRGRGGAGFPTARKWDAVRRAPGDEKYVMCNGDEGDPGAFMDRMILESYPYRVIEGMVIAGLAVGAQRGIFYIRREYPLAVTRIRGAIEKCRVAGILGEDILGSGRNFDAEVRLGAGAFVCGEESSLIASLEGKRPVPRLRPPYPAQQGFRNCPTLINNVETLALVPWILRNGADAFAALGTVRSKGTKVFSLAGKVSRAGLIEVPMGTTIRQIVEEIGGGVPNGKGFKAVQIGGPSGGCIPAALGNLPVDYEALTEAGAMMGSGGMVVLDGSDCIVEMARYFLSFTQLESCGRCTPCRVGTKQMLDLLTILCEGKGTYDDLERLQRLARTIKEQSLCGLGKTAPNPVLTGLKHFYAEFEAHVKGWCPAGKCKALVHYSISEKCIGCTKCAQQCPVDAIAMKPYERHEIDDAKCTRCGACYQVCPVEAVVIGPLPGRATGTPDA